MDFGRKGDNKRAMNLMWRTGMSLKDAWKVVQGKKSTRKKSTSKKSKRNCFGAGACAEGYEINPATGRMRKICEYGRNVVTGKCLKPPRTIGTPPMGYEYNVDTGKYRKICEYGRDINTGRCLPAPRVVAMRDGYEINPATGRMRKVCVYGRNPLTGKCYGRPMDRSMAPPLGYEYAPNGKLRKICLYGRDTMSGRCLGKPRLRPVGVPEGYEINPATGRYRKMCPDGYMRNARGRCVPLVRSVQYEDAVEFDVPLENYPIVPYSARSKSSSLSPSCLNNPFIPGCFDSKKPLRSTNPFDDNYDTQSPYPLNFNPFDDPVVEDDDDYDPFSVFSFGKKRRPKTRRSCFGTCKSCNI